MLHIKSFTLGFAAENTYIIYADNKSAWLIDPGSKSSGETDYIANFIKEKGLKIEKILLTHAHIDHVLGLQWAFDTFKTPVLMHREEQQILDMFQMSGMRFGFQLPSINVEVKYIKEGDKLTLDDEEFEIYHVPGHSPGSVVYHNTTSKFMFSGDVLFKGSIGRTDLYKGNHDQLIESIKTKLFVLDPETAVLAGHGDPTLIGTEKKTNPFFS